MRKMNRKQEDAPAQNSPKISTADIRDYINKQKEIFKTEGKTSITLISGNIQKDLNVTKRLPMVCNAMRQVMDNGDIVLHTTPKGQSSTIKIKYFI